MANRKTMNRKKEGSDMAGYNVTPGNFWDIGNYSRAVKRISESLTLNEDLIKMFTERADIESKYSKKLTEWHTRWGKHLEESSMYATMKTAALGTLKEAEDRAKIHMDCWSKIHDQVVENIKRHKESHYHKALIGIKEAKDYDDEFAKAQKPWATAYGKVHRAKKNFHASCKTQESALQSLNAVKQDEEMPAEKIKKSEDTLRKAEKGVETMKKKYEEKLARIEPLNSTYEQEMRNVYNKWAKDEERRKDFIQRTLVDFHKAVNICSDNRLKECFDNQLNVAYSGKSEYDVKWWSENFGADMPRNWPKFEVYSAFEWNRWSNSYSISSHQKKNSRRYTTRRRSPYGSRTRELGDVPEMPQPISAVDPPPSQAYQTQSLYQQNKHHSQEPISAPPAYETATNVESNPFMNGDSKDGYNDDDDDDEEDWDEPPPIPGGGIPVRALYDYTKVEDDELSFNAGDVLTKLTEEDEQGWCRGRLNGLEGLYPANYVEAI